MASSNDLLSEIRRELDARLRELRPLVAEYERLLTAAGALASGEQQRPTRRRGAAPKVAGRKAAVPKAVVPKAAGPKAAAPKVASRRTAGRKAAVRNAPAPVNASAPARRGIPAKPASRPGATAKRVQRGAAATAIVAALEHGSHTVSELAIVTAMRGAIIRSNLSRLQQAGTVTRTKRAGDGKAAYALTVAPV